jgi:tetrahydromethanopterin S-methyltransferase subunit G
VGAEAIVAVIATLLGIATWSHQQRQSVLNERFTSIKRRLEGIEKDINEFPIIYASKSDLNTGLSDIKDRLNHINDKLDQLIMSKINEKI